MSLVKFSRANLTPREDILKKTPSRWIRSNVNSDVRAKKKFNDDKLAQVQTKVGKRRKKHKHKAPKHNNMKTASNSFPSEGIEDE